MTAERKREAREKFLLGGIVVRAGLTRADRHFCSVVSSNCPTSLRALPSIGGCAILARKHSRRPR